MKSKQNKSNWHSNIKEKGWILPPPFHLILLLTTALVPHGFYLYRSHKHRLLGGLQGPCAPFFSTRKTGWIQPIMHFYKCGINRMHGRVLIDLKWGRAYVCSQIRIGLGSRPHFCRNFALQWLHNSIKRLGPYLHKEYSWMYGTERSIVNSQTI